MNNMDWVAKMKTAMELVHSACTENTDWTKCKECPFTIYCDAINLAVSQKTPEDEGWIEEGGEYTW